MSNVKENVRKLLKRVPDNCSLEDFQYHLYVMQKVNNGIKDVNAGRVYSQADIEKKMAIWMK